LRTDIGNLVTRLVNSLENIKQITSFVKRDGPVPWGMESSGALEAPELLGLSVAQRSIVEAGRLDLGGGR